MKNDPQARRDARLRERLATFLSAHYIPSIPEGILITRLLECFREEIADSMESDTEAAGGPDESLAMLAECRINGTVFRLWRNEAKSEWISSADTDGREPFRASFGSWEEAVEDFVEDVRILASTTAVTAAARCALRG